MSPFVIAQASPGLGVGTLLFPLLLFAVFWFFIIRPQRKREKERQEMIDNVDKGARVVTLGGIHGTVLKVEDDSLLVEVDSNTKLRFDKAAVGRVVAKK